MNAKRILRGPVFWITLAALAVLLATNVIASMSGPKLISTGEAFAAINSGKVVSALVVDTDQSLTLTMSDGTRQRAEFANAQGVALTNLLQQSMQDGKLKDGYDVKVPRDNYFTALVGTILPFILMMALLFYFMNQMQGGGRAMQFGKARTKNVNKDMPQTTFADVAGVEEAVEELQEIKEFLQEPAKFQAVGAKIPKGVLLYGPPGTGKTLLARAVAGEAGVPFFSISGSDFVEMFVGVGASRVRDLFEQAKANAPAIIFIDEIDAVGRHRGAGLGGGHDEREQTLNQMLVEMDGFDVTGGVILIAATNRPDILDPALLRPGRFDRQVQVTAPDLKGRQHILTVHAKGKPLADDVDLFAVARRTPGFTGADLANVLNEAALLTARAGRQFIDNGLLDEAIDRVIAGPQQRSRVMSEHEKLVTAYHEGGHALVAAAMPNADPVQKITILPRGRALGYTMVLPEQDKYSVSRSEMLGQLSYMLGGRAAEELVFHDPTTGAHNDIEKATTTARAMVMQYGMTERLGAVFYGQSNGDVFLGRDLGHIKEYSESVSAIIDEEVRTLIDTAHHEAFEVLDHNREILDALVLRLLEKETLQRDEIAEIFAAIRKRDPRGPWTGSSRRLPSTREPVAFREPASAETSEGASAEASEGASAEASTATSAETSEGASAEASTATSAETSEGASAEASPAPGSLDRSRAAADDSGSSEGTSS